MYNIEPKVQRVIAAASQYKLESYADLTIRALISKIVRKYESRSDVMSELIQVRKKAQLTLPLSVRQKLGVEVGDYMEVQVRDGEIVLKVKKLVDKDQAWFWTERWQQGEKEAEEDIHAGRVHSFPDATSAVTHLHSRVGKRQSKTGKRSG